MTYGPFFGNVVVPGSLESLAHGQAVGRAGVAKQRGEGNLWKLYWAGHGPE